MFEKEIEQYELVRQEYQQIIADKMGQRQWMEYNEILFSAHSCAIEGNTFTVDDTRILREQGMAMIPVGRSLLECTEMADHFRAFDYMVSHLQLPFDEAFLKEVNRLVTEHTLSYRAAGAVAGEYTTQAPLKFHPAKSQPPPAYHQARRPCCLHRRTQGNSVRGHG